MIILGSLKHQNSQININIEPIVRIAINYIRLVLRFLCEEIIAIIDIITNIKIDTTSTICIISGFSFTVQ